MSANVVDFRHGLVRKQGKTGPKGMSHPSGKVTAIDQDTGLPIVDRNAQAAASSPSPNPKASPASPIGGKEKESGRDILHASNDPEAIAEKAQDEHGEIKAELQKAIAGIAGAKLHGDRDEKPEERVDEKVEDEGQNPRTIPDFSGFRIAVGSVAAKNLVVDAIRRSFEVVREKDEFDKGAADTGFHGHMMQVRMPGSDVTHEVQVLPQQVADATEKTHDLYEKARTGDAGAAKELKGKNEDAWAQFQAQQKPEKGEKKAVNPEQETGGAKRTSSPVSNFQSGDKVKLKSGGQATIVYAPPKDAQIRMYRLRTEDGKTLHIKARDMDKRIEPSNASDDGKWIGVDLDATLAHYTAFKGAGHIGQPIPEMLNRVKKWLAEGKDVRIFTARVADDKTGEARRAIEKWCKQHLGKELPITNIKDHKMVQLWDDRAVQVQKNRGVPLGDPHAAMAS